ncbi:hypothetical protein B9W62_18185 [Streptomyces sp. CS113]|nr:hypothetical protein B9W62_18185 [Streptomyces sp. CS113]
MTGPLRRVVAGPRQGEGASRLPRTPSAKGSESRPTRPFGGKLPIPAPFDCLLDTANFQAP